MSGALASHLVGSTAKGLNALAIWPTLYVWGIACLASDLAALPRPSTTAVVLLCATAWSVYLVDRAKLRDAWRDPGDEAANPGRTRWVWSHRWMMRSLAALCVLLALGAAWTLAPLLVLAPLTGQAAAWLYAGTPRRAHLSPRLKDDWTLKNLAAAVGIAGFAVSVVASDTMTPMFEMAGMVGPILLPTVAADCLLCDIPDRAGDALNHTRTVPVVFGEAAGRIAAAGLSVLAGAQVLFLTSPVAPGWGWAVIFSGLASAILPAGWIRTVVDVRMPLLAVAMMMLT
ncbi:MAG: hypothetical protein D6695_03835 [Planctomycetota bacterium]|nr:MAG: hypothetical protein D6695_03835 [Planctomycetota bacterium]